MATTDECIEFALKNIGLWWRYRISRHCDEWKYIIIGRVFESEIILIPPSLKISESSSNGSYRNTDEVWWRYGISRSCDEWHKTYISCDWNISTSISTNQKPMSSMFYKLSCMTAFVMSSYWRTTIGLLKEFTTIVVVDHLINKYDKCITFTSKIW